MYVCAHISAGPQYQWHARYRSTIEAVDGFRNTLRELDIRPGDNDEPPSMSVSPQCDDCDSAMNFHDYPSARFELGPRGGIRRVPA